MTEKKESVKYDTDKTRWDLVPFDAVEEIVKTFNYGAVKYGDRNWESTGFRYGRVFASLIRHLTSWWMGRDIDPESGINHLAHAGANLLFLIAFQLRGIGQDDRVKIEVDE